MDHEASVRRTVHTLLREQQLGVLSTVGDDSPYASLVAFAASADDRRLFFVTPRATRKYANIARNPRVALLVNNSMNLPADFHRAAAVTAIGRAASVPAADAADSRAHYLAKHPYLDDFVHSPSCELIAIRVERYIMVERFQNVTEIRIDHDLDHTD
jgi:nitroimidazol reductase NimA-like FMN-containing flavoprotein (pyridoxamine 5'-phosphate oxidase superfamily)